jgi:PPK2 family polyphosphate:nucleotide phosphotransferase
MGKDKKDDGKLWYQPRPGKKVKLADLDPAETFGYTEESAEDPFKDNRKELRDFQEMLYAGNEHAVLLVLQGMDTAGKDGTIKDVLAKVNPQGMEVTSFKVPTEEELAHDFLWRIHKAVPRKRMIGVFNRSQYEDVVAVRVRKLLPEAQWRRRYETINAFERILTDNGVTLVKVFLHIGPDEQAYRIRRRQERPHKRWKLSDSDFEDRKLWYPFQEAYQDAITECHTAHAPWHVVPADHKWFRNLAISRLLVQTMKGLGLEYPEPISGIEDREIPAVDASEP